MRNHEKSSEYQDNKVSRRKFLGAAVATAAVVSTTTNYVQAKSSNPPKFKLNYAPHFGMFREHVGEDLIDQLKFIADQGFTAIEDNNMFRRTKETQDKIAQQMSRSNLTMGVFVANAKLFNDKTFVRSDKATREVLVKQMKKSVELAKRVNAKWCTVIMGINDQSMEWDYQTANAIENLKWCARVCEPSGLVMVVEPLNHFRDHPGQFLTKISQAYQICSAVGSPSCKILDDLYHQQTTEGNLIANIDLAWDQIAYFQVADNPTWAEPTTGEINYKNIFKHLYKKGYKGIVGAEHGNSKPGKEGEKAVIEAYRFCDNF